MAGYATIKNKLTPHSGISFRVVIVGLRVLLLATFPRAGQYFAASIVLVSVSCLFTVVVLNIHHRGAMGYEVPRCIQIVFIDCIGRLLFVHPPISKLTHQKTKVSTVQRLRQVVVRVVEPEACESFCEKSKTQTGRCASFDHLVVTETIVKLCDRADGDPSRDLIIWAGRGLVNNS